MKLRTLLFSLLLLAVGFPLHAAETLTYPLEICNSKFFNRPYQGTLGNEWDWTYAVKFVINDPQFGITYPTAQKTIYLNSVSLGIFPGEKTVNNLGAELRSSDHDTLYFNEVKATYNNKSLTFKDNQTQTWKMATFTFQHPVKVDINTQYKLDFTPDDAYLNLGYGKVPKGNKICSVFWKTNHYYDSDGKSPVMACVVSQPQAVGQARCWSALSDAVKNKTDPILDFTDYPKDTPFVFDTDIDLHSLTIVGDRNLQFRVGDEAGADVAKPTPTLSIGGFASEAGISATNRFFNSIRGGTIEIPEGKTFTVTTENGECTIPCTFTGKGTLKVTGKNIFNVNQQYPLNVQSVLVENGRLRFNDSTTEHKHLCAITVGDKGLVQLSDWGDVTVITAGITLMDNSLLVLYNQAGSGKTVCKAPIHIATTTTSATIRNETQFLDNTELNGGIDGTGTLKFRCSSTASARTLKVSGNISGTFSVDIDNCNIDIDSTTNTNTGSVAINGTSYVKADYLGSLGTGITTLGPQAILERTTVSNGDSKSDNIQGTGTVRLRFDGSEQNNKIHFGKFNGTTEIMEGLLCLTNDMTVGNRLKITGGALETSEKETKFTKTLEIAGPVTLHCNEGKNLTLTGDLIGTTAVSSLIKRGMAKLTLANKNTHITELKIRDSTNENVGNIYVNEGSTFDILHVSPDKDGNTDVQPRLHINRGAALRIMPGATYSATGPLELDSGAILDVSQGTKLTANAVSFPAGTDGSREITVKIPPRAIYPLVLIEAGNPNTITKEKIPTKYTIQLHDNTQTEGYELTADNNRLLLNITGLPKPNISTDHPESEDTTSYSDRAKNVILNAGEGLIPQKVTAVVSRVVDGAVKKVSLNAQGVSDVLGLLNGITVKKTAANEIVVDYNFGIAGIGAVTLAEGETVGTEKPGQYIILKAEVNGGVNSTEAITYAFNTHIKVYESNEGGTETELPATEVTEVTDITGKTVGRASGRFRYVRFPMRNVTHRYRLALSGSSAELLSYSVAVPPAGSTFITARPGKMTDLMTLKPAEAHRQLSVKISGGGIYEGQHFELRDSSGNLLATGTPDAQGIVSFSCEKKIPAGSSVTIAAENCTGDVVFFSNTWDFAGTTYQKTAPIQSMIAATPKYDFIKETWSKNITGDVTIDKKPNPKHSTYRIPGIASNGKGEVIAVYDIRWLSQDDLGVATNTPKGTWSPMDMGESYSGTEGNTWNAPKIGIDVPNVYEPKTGKAYDAHVGFDFGDPCIVYYPGDKNKKYEEAYFVMGITGGGLAGHGGVNKGNPLNGLALYKRSVGENSPWKPVFPNKSQTVKLSGSDSAGETLDLPDNTSFETVVFDALAKTITDQPKGERDKLFLKPENLEADQKTITSATVRRLARGVLQGPGHGLVTTKACGAIPAGAIVFPMQWFHDYDAWWYESDYAWTEKALAFALYSADGGSTWQATRFGRRPNPAAIPEDLGTQENSITQLDDGSLYMIAKHVKGGRYCYRTTDGKDWLFTEKLQSNAVQGSILRIGKDREDRSWYAMAYSTGPNRSQLKIFFGYDNTAQNTTLPVSGASADTRPIVWNIDHPLMIHEGDTGGRSYNSMCLLDGGKTLGILYEANMHIYFKRIDISRNVQLE